MDREEASKNEQAILGRYQNTYTYTKKMAERHLLRYGSKKIRICLTRPSMITQCSLEPMIGWTETVSAVGAFGFPFLLGISKSIFLPENDLDFVPGDYSSNAILCATAYVG
jgi:hypothetical protein